MAQKKYTPILPFDGTLSENFITYDNLPYHQNMDYIRPENIKKDSGNIIKYYRCSDVKPCYVGEVMPEEETCDEEDACSEENTGTEEDDSTESV